MHTSLTERQLEVLYLLSEGLSNQEIAQRLVVTVGTVKWHNRQIYNQLGTRNRMEAVTLANKLGLLKTDRQPDTISIKKEAAPVGVAQRIYFTTSRDHVRIAYAVSGSGPPLVKAAHFLNHLEYDWESPVWRHWMEAFSSEYTYIRYDTRGTGLSDWEVDNQSLEYWVDDLEAVVDATGLDHFPIIGASQGGPVAIKYATRHPDKVSHLILYGAYGARDPKTFNPGELSSEGKALIKMIETGWGRDNPAFRRLFATMFIPEATMEELESFENIMKLSAPAENVARLQTEARLLNIRDKAMTLSVPTLVLHCRKDEVVSLKEGQALAALIPGAQFVLLESGNHILRENEPAWAKFLREIRRFLAV